MTSRSKRRLAVLALALGLIAAVPYGFNAVADRNPDVVSPAGFITFAGMHEKWSNARGISVWTGPCAVHYFSAAQESIFVFDAPAFSTGKLHLPPASITLRVACAVALAGVWLLVVCGRLLARRWIRSGPGVRPID